MSTKSYKGRRFEIQVAKDLSLWWTNGARSDVYWHTGDSGGRATKRAKKGLSTKGLYGDIKATDPIGQPFLDYFTIECKNGYGRASLMDLVDKPIDGAMQVYEQWIDQAFQGMINAQSKSWLLIVKRDRRETIVIYPSGTFPYVIPSPRIEMVSNSAKGNIWVEGILWKDWLRTINPVDFRGPGCSLNEAKPS